MELEGPQYGEVLGGAQYGKPYDVGSSMVSVPQYGNVELLGRSSMSRFIRGGQYDKVYGGTPVWRGVSGGSIANPFWRDRVWFLHSAEAAAPATPGQVFRFIENST